MTANASSQLRWTALDGGGTRHGLGRPSIAQLFIRRPILLVNLHEMWNAEYLEHQPAFSGPQSMLQLGMLFEYLLQLCPNGSEGLEMLGYPT